MKEVTLKQALSKPQMGLVLAFFTLNVVIFGLDGGANGGIFSKSGSNTSVINSVKEGLKRFSAIDSGPLPEAVAKTFRGASYTENISQESITLYRAYGGDAGELGSYWSRTKPAGPLQSRMIVHRPCMGQYS